MMRTRRIIAAVLAAICISSMVSVTAYAQSPCQVQVYDTGNEGLALKTSPDINAGRYLYIPEKASLSIDQIINGWGHTSYSGKTGWVALQYTKIQGNYTVPEPYYGLIVPTPYTVSGTLGEGLELRVDPTIQCSTYGPIPEGMTVMVSAISNDWAYTWYNGHTGWANLTYLKKWEAPAEPTKDNYYVIVYNTYQEGLALKVTPDINSTRILLIPENTALTIDAVSDNGWGHTSYRGYSGWVSLRYTQILGTYPTESPSWGWISPRFYTVTGTEGEGLELRSKPTVECSSFGAVPEETQLVVQAINYDWAYTTYNGHSGWCNLTYLR